MREGRGRTNAPSARLIVAALLVVSVSLGTASASFAAPSRQEVAAAQARLDQLNQHLDLLVEQYNQATNALHQVESRLADMRSFAAQAQAQADAAQALLSARVISAFTGAGSQLEVLLGSDSLAQFSDRLTFLSNLVGGDSDVATQAEVKGQIAKRAAADLLVVAKKRQGIVDDLAAKKSEILAGISEQQALVSKLRSQLSRAEAAAKAAAERAATLAAQQAAPAPGAVFGPAPGVSPGAATAVSAAYSVLGVPYQWGGASPSTGFDCSGLTMWAWAQGGVSLPHSAALQYAVLPHISRADLRPGDLVFFYTPISHVGMYVGGGMMIHAPHTGSVVSLVSLASEPSYVGAGRP